MKHPKEMKIGYDPQHIVFLFRVLGCILRDKYWLLSEGMISNLQSDTLILRKVRNVKDVATCMKLRHQKK